MLVNEIAVLRHAGDACFLWARRQRVLSANQLTHMERTRLDMRLEAHLDGLRVAGETGWQAALEELRTSRRPGAVFATTALALQSGHPARFETVLSLAGSNAGNVNAMVSAIGWSDLGAVRSQLNRWRTSAEVGMRALGIAGLTAHRCAIGPSLPASLRGPHALVRARAAKAAGELARGELAPLLRALLDDEDPLSRFQAARALARLGNDDPRVRQALLLQIEDGGPLTARAVFSLVELDPRGGQSLFRDWAREPSTRKRAALVAGALGDPERVQDLIPWMSDDDTARAAGEAFRTITGADLLGCHLARPRPAHVVGDPNDDPNDPGVELDAEHALRFPSALLIARWWRSHRGAFTARVRYLDGKEVGVEGGPRTPAQMAVLRALVRAGRPAHQTMAALSLAQEDRGCVTIETHAAATRVHPLPGWNDGTGPEHGARPRRVGATTRDNLRPVSGTDRR